MRTFPASLIAAVALNLPIHAQTYEPGVTVGTFAGSGFYGRLDGTGQETMFDNPNLMVADSHGNVFVWDSNNQRIRRITPDAVVSTFAGGGSATTGVGTSVSLNRSFYGMAIDQEDTIWMLNHRIRAITYNATEHQSGNAVVSVPHFP